MPALCPGSGKAGELEWNAGTGNPGCLGSPLAVAWAVADFPFLLLALGSMKVRGVPSQVWVPGLLGSQPMGEPS